MQLCGYLVEPFQHEKGEAYSLLCMWILTDISRAVELLDKLQRTGEVPPQKLQALQRVLQSEFCNAVREVRHLTCTTPLYISFVSRPTVSLQVYEHVYETVDINSSPEVRANATAKVRYHLTNICLSIHDSLV